MSDEGVLFTLIAVAIVVVIGVLVWISYLASAITVAFTSFVVKLPIFIMIIMFIIFPPTLIVFLVGLAMIEFGFAEKLFEDKKLKD